MGAHKTELEASSQARRPTTRGDFCCWRGIDSAGASRWPGPAECFCEKFHCAPAAGACCQPASQRSREGPPAGQAPELPRDDQIRSRPPLKRSTPSLPLCSGGDSGQHKSGPVVRWAIAGALARAVNRWASIGGGGGALFVRWCVCCCRRPPNDAAGAGLPRWSRQERPVWDWPGGRRARARHSVGASRRTHAHSSGR
jgi:hypothetical protein